MDQLFCGVCYNFARNAYVQKHVPEADTLGVARCAQAKALEQQFDGCWEYSADRFRRAPLPLVRRLCAVRVPPVRFDGFVGADNWFKLERQYTGFDPLGPIMEVAPFYSP
eukprot:jgi/Mesvir1/14589/Mv05262-RA.1